jgi:hypothetical protein
LDTDKATLILELTDVATRFRSTLEKVLQTLQYIPPPFKSFPFGSCGICSDMLGSILNGMWTGPALYVGASDQMEQSHAWLRYEDIVIDVTGDQFPGRPPVFVGPPDSWFDLWKVDEPLVNPAEYVYSWDLDCNRIYDRVFESTNDPKP